MHIHEFQLSQEVVSEISKRALERSKQLKRAWQSGAKRSEWAVQANEHSERPSGPFKMRLLWVETDPYRGPRHATPEVCPGGPNYNVNINFMMKFLVGLATNPYKRLCWMSGQLLLPVGVTPMNRKRRMDSSTYHTSEPTLYLLIHILILSIRGIMTRGGRF